MWPAVRKYFSSTLFFISSCLWFKRTLGTQIWCGDNKCWVDGSKSNEKVWRIEKKKQQKKIKYRNNKRYIGLYLSAMLIITWHRVEKYKGWKWKKREKLTRYLLERKIIPVFSTRNNERSKKKKKYYVEILEPRKADAEERRTQELRFFLCRCVGVCSFSVILSVSVFLLFFSVQ